METGKIHIYYGDGKGKSTAAFGLALRALGHGERAVVVQFLKPGTSGELRALEQLSGATCLSGMPIEKFTFQMTEEELRETRLWCDRLLERAVAAAAGARILVLDEVIDAYELGLLAREALHRLLQSPPPGTELVLTGHSLPDVPARHAHYITCMKKEKHPYDSGLPARKGIEF